MKVNGADSVSNDPAARLSAFLRNDLGLMATKVGCDAGDCGACTVFSPTILSRIAYERVSCITVQRNVGFARRG